MTLWVLLRHVHALLALTSVLLFFGRGIWVVVLQRQLHNRLLRVLPHSVDTLLLASGIALMVWSAQYPPHSAWLNLKLPLIVLYIGLGIAAFRAAQAPRIVRMGLFAAALAVFAWVLAIAVTRQPLGF